MVSDKESIVSSSAMHRREWLATSPTWERLLPVTYTDPYHSIDRIIAADKAVCVPTHPSIEDTLRIMRMLFQIPELRDRNIGGPGAIHQKFLIDLSTKPFGLETTLVVTDHTRNKAKMRGKDIPEGLEIKSVIRYGRFIRHFFEQKKKSLLVVASQADQMDELKPPDKPAIEFILRVLESARIKNVLFVPIGIEILGINGDYRRARNLTPARHEYRLHFGQGFSDEEVRVTAQKEGVSTDFWMYEQQLPLVPPEYISKQPDLS
jgi:hypothetical protein